MRHRLVTLVIQEVRLAALGVVADHAFEGDHRAVLAAQQAIGNLARHDGMPRQREEVSVFGNLRGCSPTRRSPAAGRRFRRRRRAVADGPANSWLRASTMLPAISRMRGNWLQ